VKVITNPVEALVDIGKENSQLHEEVQALYREVDWYRRGLTYISEMPNQAGPVATLVLQKRPFKT